MKTNGFLLKVYEMFGSEMPLGVRLGKSFNYLSTYRLLNKIFPCIIVMIFKEQQIFRYHALLIGSVKGIVIYVLFHRRFSNKKVTSIHL